MTKNEAIAAVRANPSDPRAWFRLGQFMELDNQLNKAKLCYERALTLQPSESLAHIIVEALQNAEWLEQVIADEVQFAEEHRSPPAYPSERQEETGEKQTSWAGVLLLLIGLCITPLLCTSYFSGPASSPEHSDISAWVMCQQFAERELRAPATARFPNSSEVSITHEDDGRYLIVGYVDAENGFGALIRSDFICEIDYSGNDRWRLIDLTFVE